MTESEEPLIKKIKIELKSIDKVISQLQKSNEKIKAVLDDDFLKEITMIEVHTAIIKEKKYISKIISILNEKMPLHSLQHLKRVRNSEIILLKSECLTGKAIEKYLEEYIPEVMDYFSDYRVGKVAEKPPILKKHFDACNKIWPCNFHPNKYYENLVSGNMFTDIEIEFHRSVMVLAFETMKFYNLSLESFNNVSIVIDPSINSIVAISLDNKKHHPIQHSSMIAIDNVAKTQNGGSWGGRDKNILSSGVNGELKTYLLKLKPNLKFGAKQFISKRDISEELNSEEYGPYLCTNYNVYSIIEPCIMCSMALVHARVKRLFFCFTNELNGAVCSRIKLQTIASLNHHFEVFTGFI